MVDAKYSSTAEMISACRFRNLRFWGLSFLRIVVQMLGPHINNLAKLVKKLHPSQKLFLVKKSRAGNLQRSKAHYRIKRFNDARREFYQIRESLPEIKISNNPKAGYVSFDPPKNFCLFENYQQTLAFLMDLRSMTTEAGRFTRGGRIPPIFANFPAIESINAASGLVLAAEVDRWMRLLDKKVRSFDDLWHPHIAQFFHDAGLFELLKVIPKTVGVTPDEPLIEPLKYQTGTVAEGETADRMRQELEALCGKSIGPSTRVYDALSEAMTNVVHHAYPKDFKFWPPVPINRWWLGGSWQTQEETVTVQMYDQGIGIPRTLPKSKHWSEVLPILGRIDRESSDAGMIEAAMDYGRTSTGESGRGKGLAQMADWIIESTSGSLKILSGKGMVTVLPGKSPIRTKLSTEFRGTLVEWEVCLK